MRKANFMLIETDDHNAIVTAEEAATYFTSRPFTITGFMFDDEAEALSLSERGIPDADA